MLAVAKDANPLNYKNAQFWQPDVTVATVVVRDGRFLMVEETANGRLVLNHGRWQDRQLVPAEWVERSLSPHFDTDVRDYRYGYQWWGGTATWRGQPVAWHAGFGNGGQRLYVVPALDMTIVTTAGAYDEDATAIRVNDLVQEIIDCVKN